MPVARAELLRSVYRRYYTIGGKMFGPLAGARDLTEDVLKEFYSYYYECSECRRCSWFCPFGFDTAEMTIMARELMISVGIQTKYITEVIAKVAVIGNNLGLPPKAFMATMDFIKDEIKTATGVDIEIPVNRKGAEVLMVTPSAEFFGPEHMGTFIGWAKMFHAIGLDYTLSTYNSEGGNFGIFHSYEQLKRITQRIANEAKRLGVKMLIGGECGHMWRVWHNHLDTIAGPFDFLTETRSPITGTDFGTPIVHICEFTADLIRHGKLNLDPSRNDQYIVTYADSCNPARAMGIIEEPRYILRNVCNNYVEMDPNYSRENVYCCGSGGGLLTDEVMELRMKGALPRAMAIKETGANFVALICAICKAAHTPLLKYYEHTAQVGGVHELVGNAVVLEGEKKKGGKSQCEICDAIFDTEDECCEHCEVEHKIAKASCEVCCKSV